MGDNPRFQNRLKTVGGVVLTRIC